MDALFQELLVIHEDGTCLYHPNCLLLAPGTKVLRSCPCCEQQVKQLQGGCWTENEDEDPGSDDTWTTYCGTEAGSSGGFQDGLDSSTRMVRSGDDQSNTGPLLSQHRLMESVLSRWCQVKRLPPQQVDFTTNAPFVFQQLQKLDRRVQQQDAVLRENQVAMRQLQKAMKKQNDTFQKQVLEILGTVRSSPKQEDESYKQTSDDNISLKTRASLKSLKSTEAHSLLPRESRIRGMNRSPSSSQHRLGDIQLDGSFSRVSEDLPSIDAIFETPANTSSTGDAPRHRPKLSMRASSSKSSKLSATAPPLEIILEGGHQLSGEDKRRPTRRLKSMYKPEELFRRASSSEISSCRWGERSSASDNDSVSSLNNSRRCIHAVRPRSAPTEILTRMHSSKRQVSCLTLDPAWSMPSVNDEDGDDIDTNV